MESLSTAPCQNEFNTVAADDSVTKHKNQKVIGFLGIKMIRSKDSSMSSPLMTTDDYLSFCVASPGWTQIPGGYLGVPHTISVPSDKSAKEIISIYKEENIVHNLNINDLFVTEYTHHTPLRLLHILMDVGNEIFKDARPRKQVEAKIINDFVRSKTKLLSSKKL